jgi:hypothetical protein
MAHFNPEGTVTRLEVKASTAGPLGPRDVVAKAERSESLTPMLLGAPQSGPQPTDSAKPEPLGILELLDAAPEPTDGAMPDPLLQGLVDRLPKPDSIWSLDDRGKWLRAAAVIFTLVYKTDEGDRDSHRHSSAPKALP